MKYWDYLNSFYINYFSKTNGLNLFFEIGSPNRSFGNKEPRNYFGHNIGSNFGMRKYGIFNHENLMLGFEYTRSVQSSYYNILPSPNWYDNQEVQLFIISRDEIGHLTVALTLMTSFL